MDPLMPATAPETIEMTPVKTRAMVAAEKKEAARIAAENAENAEAVTSL